MNPTGDCPCGGGARPGASLPYARCCGRWHAGAGHLLAPTAETLMRSRYAAFVLDLRGYLLDTWHASTRPVALDAPPAGLKWLGLEVRGQWAIDAWHAEVEFVARSKQGGRALRLHERSRFVREDGRWFYVDGDLKSP